MTKLDCRGHPDVVGVLFESQAQDADLFVLKDPEGLDDFFHEPVHLFGIDLLDLLEEAKIIADLFGDLDERAEIFGETTAAETKRRIEETPPDAIIHPHAVGD